MRKWVGPIRGCSVCDLVIEIWFTFWKLYIYLKVEMYARVCYVVVLVYERAYACIYEYIHI